MGTETIFKFAADCAIQYFLFVGPAIATIGTAGLFVRRLESSGPVAKHVLNLNRPLGQNLITVIASSAIETASALGKIP